MTQASEFSGLATLTSEYIYRGLAMSDGDPAAQLGLDYEHDSGFFAGIWASTIDLSSRVGQRDYELDFYAGYHFESQRSFTATATLLRYTYPGQTGTHSYDYDELLLSASWREHYAIELGFTNDLYGLGINARHWEFQFEWPVANVWVLGATLGRNDLSEAGVSRYYYWNIGGSARFSRLIVDLRWFDNETPSGFAAPNSANSRFVVGISLAF
jgi:uncharacterized protein (TIGR02001 family)